MSVPLTLMNVTISAPIPLDCIHVAVILDGDSLPTDTVVKVES